MKRITFSDKFTESLVVLLYSYDTVPVCLNNENMKKYVEDFIENGSYINKVFNKKYDKMSDLIIWKRKLADICLPKKI